MTKGNAVSDHVLNTVYNNILCNQPVNHRGICRATPQFGSKSVYKATRFLEKMGKIVRDDDWPPRFRVVQEQRE